jgi:hypothetical protein
MSNRPQRDNNERNTSAAEGIFLRRQLVSYAIDSINYTVHGLGIDATPVNVPERKPLADNTAGAAAVREVIMPKDAIVMAEIEPNPSSNQTPLNPLEAAQQKVNAAFINQTGR